MEQEPDECCLLHDDEGGYFFLIPETDDEEDEEEEETEGIEEPLRNKTPFEIFLQFTREQYELDNGKERPADFSYHGFLFDCSETWNTMMSDDDRKPFLKEAQKDKERYEKELEEYNKLKGIEKDLPNFHRPKLPYSAFYYFCESRRAKVKEENPDLNVFDVAIKLGEMWRCISLEERISFEKIAEEARKTYEQELWDFGQNCRDHPDRVPVRPVTT